MSIVQSQYFLWRTQRHNSDFDFLDYITVPSVFRYPAAAAHAAQDRSDPWGGGTCQRRVPQTSGAT